MKCILNAFIAGILVLLPATVLSQEQETKFFLTTQPCAPVIQMTNTVMNKYGEKPLHSGRGMQRSSSDSKEYWSSMMFFVNQDSGTWTLVSLYDDGTACLVANGQDFKPYTR
jgi:hypothetical protein